mgnify:CR=1 FL=1
MQRPDRKQVEALISNDPLLRAVRAEVEALADGDAAHDIDHLLRVAVWTLRCAPELDPRSAIAAALLHDIVNVPKNSPDRSARASCARTKPSVCSPNFPRGIWGRGCPPRRSQTSTTQFVTTASVAARRHKAPWAARFRTPIAWKQ